MFHRSTALAALALTFFSLDTVRATPTQTQIQACSQSISLDNYQDTVTYSTSDSTAHNQSYSYSVSACTTPGVKVTSIYTQDLDSNTIYTCTLKQFDTTGTLFTTCSITNGAIATTAQSSGDQDWGDFLKVGQKPTFYTIENDYTVDYYTAPTASAASRKRRALQDEPGLEARSDLSPRINCPAGFSSCWTGVRDQFECINTSSDVESCGACPRSSDAQDCTSIAGSNEVQCFASMCKVISCDSYHTLSADGTSCEPNGRHKKRSIYATRF
ncbi:hypothetical protein BCR39DRAFT_467941 [Naematelia encephala]|uniref:Protein CPL1-like domain-containing protein n=1 Tax=Naematelia encephala TaxID=71784 RepID=A0A1Y2B258_9TREE|nr:hypothetical protein BCR39DRAFT_467941 [Naematelia encephala]